MKLVEQAWEMGERKLILTHGHGQNRGITPGFVNTNTLFFGLEIRRVLRHDEKLRRWIHHTTLDRRNPGLTRVSLKPNRAPVRNYLDADLLPDGAMHRGGKHNETAGLRWHPEMCSMA